MKSAEKSYLAMVASLPCALCDSNEPVHVHHIRAGQGMSQRASHYLTIPLCPDCHQGKSGIHGDQAMLRVMKVSELDLLAKTIERLCAPPAFLRAQAA